MESVNEHEIGSFLAKRNTFSAGRVPYREIKEVRPPCFWAI